jgi:hypothetical protein
LAQQRDLPMAGQPSNAPGAVSRAIVDLAQDGDVGADAAALAGVAEVELALADLVGDANGEVVIFNDSGFRTLALRSDAAVVADGRVETHRTAGGEDVSGFRYVRFENGMTVYFREGLDLIVTR